MNMLSFWKSLLILCGLTVVVYTSSSVESCSKLGIYAGNNNREFIVCSASQLDGKQLIKTKHICPVNTVFKDDKCIPSLIVPYTLKTNLEENTDIHGNADNKDDNIRLPCKTPGLLCTTCTQLSICISINEDSQDNITFNEIKIMTCPAGEVCTPQRHGCAPIDKNNFCPYRKFECSDTGIFPDPYDCTVYYMCDPIVNGFKKTKLTCKDGSFDSETVSCGFPMNVTACLSTPIPLCKEEFQVGPVPDNMNIYYICLPNYEDHTLAPALYRCPANLVFDILTLTCS